MTYVITSACIDLKDRACTEECPVDAIYEADRMLYINPDECVDCGKCVPACPNDAIASEYKLEPDQERFVEIAAEFFEAFPEASGGGEEVGPIAGDHPVVAAWGRP
ncbi:ferredoxin [Nocardioides bruguierae]|uniref:Ferredoxin n=1 Tax=Nocardioides bruguierae TaxID=2945102 RepID=A0A9X2IGV2_9ACTN|nr:ferredoxin [Nocardioides bruguierae]MCM0622747.1 4Fe-4S binding protein [Nocardioides bruguierae]